jgi:fatty-acyl-CoA synthase
MEGKDCHQPITYGAMIARAMERNGRRVAIKDGQRSLTYNELYARMRAVANAFVELGLEPGDGLAQLSKNSIEAIVVIGGAFLAGLRYTPLHPLGSAEDHAFIIEDAEISCLIIDEKNFGEHARIGLSDVQTPNILSHGRSQWRDLGVALSVKDAPFFEPRGTSEDIALIAYTGGTTGKPKGVVHRHKSLLANLSIAASEWEWSRSPRFLIVTPVSHAAFLLLLPVFLKGGEVVLMSSFSVNSFADAVAINKINMTFIVPTMLYRLIDCADDVKARLSTLENVVYGAAPASPRRLREAIDRFGPIFSQLYGQTEAPNAISMLFRRDHDVDVSGRLESCGVPIGDSQVKLLGADGREVALGDPGELCVRGPLVMDGYWKLPEATYEALEDGWLRTGDIARRDERGFLYLVDRKKDIIISGGFNVYPREVEDVISAHPMVAECCVIGAPDEQWGEAVTAIIVPAGEAIDLDKLKAFAREHLGAAQRPKEYAFVEALPLTGLGKVDRKAVRASYWRGQARGIN